MKRALLTGITGQDGSYLAEFLLAYDYTQAGAYFVTVCMQNRECLLGEVANGQMIVNDAGRMVEGIWNALPQYYLGVDVDEFVVMPNHIHGIVVLTAVGATPRALVTT